MHIGEDKSYSQISN